MRDQARIILPSTLSLALLSAYLMLGHVAVTSITIWITSLTLIVIGTYWWLGRISDEQDLRKFIRQIIILCAIGWMTPFAFMGPSTPLAVALSHWAAALLALVAVMIVAQNRPSNGILFGVPICLAATLTLVVAGHVDLALIPFASAAFTYGFCLYMIRHNRRMHMADVKLHEQLETINLLVRETEALADWLWVTDASHRLEQISDQFAAACRSDRATLDGLPFMTLLADEPADHPPTSSALTPLHQKMQNHEKFTSITQPLMLKGEKRWWRLSGTPRFDEQGQFAGYRGIGSDITDQYASAEQIARLARVDSLTNLPNRRGVHEELDKALREAIAHNRRCAILIIDLDRFKSVNESLSHAVGDQLLRHAAERLNDLMEVGCTCGRLAGDEFAVIIRRPDSHAAVESYARHVIATLSRPYQVEGYKIFVGASAGYAIGPSDGTSVEILSRNADLALYKSKDKGGNCVEAYVPFLLKQAEDRRILEQELRGALEKRELQLYYQPVVDAKTEQLVSFEALLRWNSAKLGAVMPSRFIPIAEDSRLINPIGEWVLRMACHEATCWPPHIKVAVNVSSEQLTDPHFASIVLAALAHSGLAPHRLEIEVTESVFLHDGGSAVQILNQLLAIGVRLSLDDFGTGYSSFGYLRKARFSTIKVDRSFVSSAAKGSVESIAIIRAVVALADGLGMSTIAEGAETAEEVDTVRSLGCRNVQGYYFGRPMTPASIRQYFPASMLPNAHQN